MVGTQMPGQRRRERPDDRRAEREAGHEARRLSERQLHFGGDIGRDADQGEFGRDHHRRAGNQDRRFQA